MDVVLRTNSEDPAMGLRRVQRFADGSGFGALIVVRSRGFVAERPFYVEPGALVGFLEAVGNMDRTLTGWALLKPFYEDDFIELTLDHAGHVRVRGELYEHSPPPQFLRFQFETDQACLAPLAADLRACLQLAAT